MASHTTIRGTVSKVLHASDRGGAIFALSCYGEERTLRVLADYTLMISAPEVEEFLEVKGSYFSGESGRQFAASEAVLLRPEGQAIVPLIADNIAFAGVGWKLSRRLWKRLGVSLYSVLDARDVSKLTGCSVPLPLAAKICTSWKEYCRRADLHDFFSKHRIPAAFLRRALDFWGSEAKALLENDPYRLAPLCGWAECDRIALQNFGVSLDAPVRLNGASVAVLSACLGRGYTAILYSVYLARLEKKLGSRSLSELASKLSVQHGVAVEFRCERHSYVIGRGPYRIERAIRNAVLSSTASQVLARPLEMQTDDITQAIERARYFGRSVLVLPRTSIPDLMTHPLATTADVLHITPWRQCLSGASENTAKSIGLAHFLRSCPLPEHFETVSLVFVHDSQSIDTLALGKVLNYLPENTPVCIVGDGAVLPPTGVGNPFEDICLIPELPKTFLRVPGSRQADSIANVAASILTGFLPTFEAKAGHTSVIEFSNVGCQVDEIEEALEQFRTASDCGNAIIFTATQRTADKLNVRLHTEGVELRSVMGLTTPFLYLKNGVRAAEGDKIVSTISNLSLGLRCGERGVITEVFDSPQFRKTGLGKRIASVALATFDSGEDLELTREQLQNLSLGYALPLARSSPSFYDTVIVLSRCRRVVDRRWLYTAVAAAKRKVSVIDDLERVVAIVEGAPRRRTRPSSIMLSQVPAGNRTVRLAGDLVRAEDD